MEIWDHLTPSIFYAGWISIFRWLSPWNSPAWMDRAQRRPGGERFSEGSGTGREWWGAAADFNHQRRKTCDLATNKPWGMIIHFNYSWVMLSLSITLLISSMGYFMEYIYIWPTKIISWMDCIVHAERWSSIHVHSECNILYPLCCHSHSWWWDDHTTPHIMHLMPAHTNSFKNLNWLVISSRRYRTQYYYCPIQSNKYIYIYRALNLTNWNGACLLWRTLHN